MLAAHTSVRGVGTDEWQAQVPMIDGWNSQSNAEPRLECSWLTGEDNKPRLST